MPRQSAITVENNFRNGLITEATGLNFPENACTEIYDCELLAEGAVRRRLGFDFEDAYTEKTIDRTNLVVKTYLWKNVAGDGNATLVVVQVGNTIYFYKTSGISLSVGAVSNTVTLTPVAGATSTGLIEAQFSDGNGFLFITHPYCEPMRVSYNTVTEAITKVDLDIKIRDFEGAIADSLGISDRPTSSLAGLTVNHTYNLYNQGWSTTNLTAWDTAQTTMPSNADVSWQFIDASGDFNAGNSSIARVYRGNTPAPKGHFIMSLKNQDRDTASGLSGVAATTTGSQRVGTSAFFAGRLWLSGLNYKDFNSKIYFTQIVENVSQYEYAYQVNDPTSKDLFDLLPSDGGVINIAEAGTIYKLAPVPGGLAVWAANGVWFITGSQGIGFTATDYSVQKISSVPTNSATSFVDVTGSILWWNVDGIYGVVAEGNLPKVQSLTDSKIKRFYDAIPFNSKTNARGVFNNVEAQVYWLYKSTDTTVLGESYEFDRVLKFDTRSGAFFPWTISSSAVKVNSIVISDAVSGAVGSNQVVRGADHVVDGSGNNVITFSVSGDAADARGPELKFLTSYESGGSHKFTFTETSNTSYLDWETYDSVGVDYTSYMITGYKIRGEGLRKHQTNWTKIYTRMSEDELQYYFNAIWDFALTGDSTGRWSVSQLVTHSNSLYSYLTRRLKVRGHGSALQFKVTSASGKPFDIVGWANNETVNQIP